MKPSFLVVSTERKAFPFFSLRTSLLIDRQIRLLKTALSFPQREKRDKVSLRAMILFLHETFNRKLRWERIRNCSKDGEEEEEKGAGSN